jgi:hypothetical protein
VVDTSGNDSVTLGLWRWLNSDETAYMQSTIDVYDGVAWQTVWTMTDPPVQDSEWTYQSFDVSAYANPAFQLRIGFSSNNDLAGYVFPSWNVDDVSITGSSCN